MKNIFKDILMSVKEIKLNENVNLNIYKKNDFYTFNKFSMFKEDLIILLSLLFL